MAKKNELRRYLDSRDRGAATKLALRLEKMTKVVVHPSSVSRWASGRVKPSKLWRIAIQKATRGGVKTENW